MPPLLVVLLLSAVSALLLAGSCFLPRLKKACSVLTVGWFALVIPIMFFGGVDMRGMLLFYLLSAAFGLLFLWGGKRA